LPDPYDDWDAGHINESQRESERIYRVLDAQRRINDLPFPLVEPSRRYLADALVDLAIDGKHRPRRRVFLFNDLLIAARSGLRGLVFMRGMQLRAGMANQVVVRGDAVSVEVSGDNTWVMSGHGEDVHELGRQLDLAVKLLGDKAATFEQSAEKTGGKGEDVLRLLEQYRHKMSTATVNSDPAVPVRAPHVGHDARAQQDRRLVELHELTERMTDLAEDMHAQHRKVVTLNQMEADLREQVEAIEDNMLGVAKRHSIDRQRARSGPVASDRIVAMSQDMLTQQTELSTVAEQARLARQAEVRQRAELETLCERWAALEADLKADGVDTSVHGSVSTEEIDRVLDDNFGDNLLERAFSSPPEKHEATREETRQIRSKSVPAHTEGNTSTVGRRRSWLARLLN